MMMHKMPITFFAINFLGLYKDPKKAKFKQLASYKGIEMKGWRYVPLFEYFTEQACVILLSHELYQNE
jgi:hypothetical protein